MNIRFESGWDFDLNIWGTTWLKCVQNVAWHGTCLEIVQQDVISKCGDLDQHDIGTCKTKAFGQKVLQLLR
jgi:hypothetical protein